MSAPVRPAPHILLCLAYARQVGCVPSPRYEVQGRKLCREHVYGVVFGEVRWKGNGVGRREWEVLVRDGVEARDSLHETVNLSFSIDRVEVHTFAGSTLR